MSDRDELYYGTGLEDGYAKARAEFGWKRNCEETPVPHRLGLYLNVIVLTYPWPWCVMCGKDRKGVFWSCVNGDGDEFTITDSALITHWLEIPGIEG